MNSNDVATVIETICDKIGLTSESFTDFVPELIRHKIATNTFGVIVSAVIIIICIEAMIVSVNRAKRIMKEDASYGSWELYDFTSVVATYIVGGVIAVAAVIALILFAEEIVEWTVSPQTNAILYIMSLLKL